MGGSGSGRYSGLGRSTVEDNRSLDVNWLNRAGCLADGWHGGWNWMRDGERVASINVASDGYSVTLRYRYRSYGDDWQDIKQRVLLHHAPCRFGGTRPYFICPGVINGKRCMRSVTKLYGAGRYFLCRHCYDLPYASQSEHTWDRALRKAQNIRIELGGSPSLYESFPDKPKHMHWKTYWRKRRISEQAAHRSLIGIAEHLGIHSPP